MRRRCAARRSSGTGPSTSRRRRIASRRRRAASTRSSSLGSAACRLGAITSSYGARPAGAASAVTSPRSAISRPSCAENVADAASALLEPGQLLEHGRRRLAEPEELRVAVRKARACGAALVEHDLDVGEPFGLRSLAARVQGRRDGFYLASPPARPASGRAAACARRPPAARAPDRGSGRRGPASPECPAGGPRARRRTSPAACGPRVPRRRGTRPARPGSAPGWWGARPRAAAPGQARSRPFVLRSGLA